MKISASIYQEMVSHALEDAPDECCGMVSARDGEAVAVYRMTNVAHSPLRYEMDSKEQFRIELGEIDDKGLELGIVYHSHTRSAPYPSQTDINLAYHPDAVYVIVGVKDPQQPEVRAYTIRGEEVAEVQLEVTA
jgi:proteasome lid subunit RPN8/RPN11